MRKGIILILDDDKRLLELYEEIFKNEFRVHTTTTVQGAQKIAEEYEVDCVLIDLKLNGNTTKGLKATEFVEGNWCVIVSGYIDGEVLREANDQGITSVIQKPINFDVLLDLVRRIVQRVEAERRMKGKLADWKKEIIEGTNKIEEVRAAMPSYKGRN